MPRNQTIFIAVTLVILALIAYLGFRTLEHEVLLRHYQAQTLAQSRTAQASAYVGGVLRQKAARLDAISEYLQLDSGAALRELVSKDSDIDNVFVLRKNRLIYPDENQPLSQDEKAWSQVITPLANDPSLLYSHNMRSEQDTPRSGWFVSNEAQAPLLIYWRYQGDVIVGFRVSYINLMSEIPGGLHEVLDAGDDLVILTENGRLLYQNREAGDDSPQLLDAAPLPYPLSFWQIAVYGKYAGALTVYLWGGLLIALLLAAVMLIGLRIYREYTRSARLARQQVSFVSQVSHELKTPLTNVTLYAELLREGLDDEQDAERRYVDVITSEGQRLSRLIQNILTFTRAPKLHLQTVDVGALMAQIVHIFTPSLSGRGMTINLRGGQGVTLYTDLDRLTQIISNFLSNAEKYAAQGQKVDVVVEERASCVDIHVRDYGSGMAEKELKMIFRPFYRVKSAITEGVSGTGIGLTIARQLAHGLHGDITVTRESPGMCFTLSLPRRARESQGEKNENTDC